MSKEGTILEEARGIRRIVLGRLVKVSSDQYIRNPNSPFYDADRKADLTDALNRFVEAESQNNTAYLKSLAVQIVQIYGILVSDNCIYDDSSLTDAYNESQKKIADLITQNRELHQKIAETNQEWQKKYDELLEQVGVIKGQYEECGKRLEQMIQLSGLQR